MTTGYGNEGCKVQAHGSRRHLEFDSQASGLGMNPAFPAAAMPLRTQYCTKYSVRSALYGHSPLHQNYGGQDSECNEPRAV